MVEKQSRHYHDLKFITTILVVLAHASRMYTGVGVVKPLLSSSDLSNLTKVIYAFHMPLFIAISGMVYGYCIDNRGKYQNTLRFLGKKAVRLLIPYYFLGLFYVAPVVCYFGIAHRSYLDCCINDILLALNPRHLWFLLVLFEIFVLCAFLKKPFQKLFFVIPLAVFLVMAYNAKRVPIYFQLQKLMVYPLYFYLGYLLNKHYARIMRVLSHPCTWIVLLAAARLAYPYRNQTTGGILTAVSAGCLVVGMTCHLPKRFSENRFVKAANKNGFGIFLFHAMIIYALYYYLGKYPVHPLFLCFGIAVAAYFASWLLTVVFRRLRLGVLIGEPINRK